MLDLLSEAFIGFLHAIAVLGLLLIGFSLGCILGDTVSHKKKLPFLLAALVLYGIIHGKYSEGSPLIINRIELFGDFFTALFGAFWGIYHARRGKADQ